MKFKGLLVVVLLALTGAALPTDRPAPAARATVTIGLIGDSITVAPDPVVVNRGDTLDFRVDPESDIQSLNIVFRSPVPFGRGASEGGLEGSRAQAARGVVRGGAEPGQRYKYLIRARTSQRTIVLDPEVEIGPGE